MKSVMLIVVAAALTCACGPAVKSRPDDAADGRQGRQVELTPQDIAEVERIGDLGARIHQKDVISAIASDILLAMVDRAEFPNFRGWLTRDWGDHFVVSFYEEVEDRITLIADMTFRPNVEPDVQLRPARELPAEEIAMFRARQTGLMAAANDCSQNFNTVVFARPDGTFDVFVLAATTDPELIVIGGHVRVRVSADGKQVLELEPYSRSCLTIDLTPDNLPPGAEVTAQFVTHVVSEYPAPTHVYASLLHDTVFYVGTSLGIWVIDRGSIGFMGQPE